jgi:5-methylcytosine-specific restriction endonuclease McrA
METVRNLEVLCEEFNSSKFFHTESTATSNNDGDDQA